MSATVSITRQHHALNAKLLAHQLDGVGVVAEPCTDKCRRCCG